MQLLKIIVMMTALLPALAIANNCAILVKLTSPYLQNKPIYLDEILSQPIVNNQLCLNNSDIANSTEAYYLELFSSNGLNLESLFIFPEYIQGDVITITTADLLTNFCRQCNDLRHYRQFVNSSRVKTIATEMDAIAAKQPDVIIFDVIKRVFQQALLDLYNEGILQGSDEASLENHQTKKTDAVDKDRQDKMENKDKNFRLPPHFLPVYDGAALQNFVPEGLHLNRIESLPLASYSVDASAASVLEFYQSYYPDYERIGFGNFVLLVKDKLPFEGYSPKYMAIPHIVISEDPLGKGKTILQITYRPDDEIKGRRVMVFKPVT
ncbi:hypothetical protein HWV03_04265 [Moritella sp. 36]|uniref:hypothetical protein n=1 Tax=Moritella sp. 36 TaxID=2746233 RepID=UPI001BAD6CB2|nr:hypothetical protein [Moritella sp. 36]QUM88093.1 hypothetical protein HWV03_04265 [Moritella sp. 36]